jgi:hypothetical protein
MSNSGDYQDIREQLEEKITNLKKQTIWSLLIVLFLIIAAVFLNIQLKKSNMIAGKSQGGSRRQHACPQTSQG